MSYLEALVYLAWLERLPATAAREQRRLLIRIEAWIVMVLRNDRARDEFVSKMMALEEQHKDVLMMVSMCDAVYGAR